MKSLTSLLAATLVAAGLSAQAQTGAAPANHPPSPAAAAAPAAVATPSTGAPTEAAAPADSTSSDHKMTPGALAARASTSRSYRMGGRAAVPTRSRNMGYKDGITLRDGKLAVTQYGQTTILTDTASFTTLTNQRVSGNGTVTLPDGTTMTLNEGDHVSLSGKLTTKRMQFVQDSTAKANLKASRKLAAKRNRGVRGAINNMGF